LRRRPQSIAPRFWTVEQPRQRREAGGKVLCSVASKSHPEARCMPVQRRPTLPLFELLFRNPKVTCPSRRAEVGFVASTPLTNADAWGRLRTQDFRIVSL
jgi:hypothetical protein